MQDEKEIFSFDLDDNDEKMKDCLKKNVGKGNKCTTNAVKYVDIYLSVPMLQVISC